MNGLLGGWLNHVLGRELRLLAMFSCCFHAASPDKFGEVTVADSPKGTFSAGYETRGARAAGDEQVDPTDPEPTMPLSLDGEVGAENLQGNRSKASLDCEESGQERAVDPTSSMTTVGSQSSFFDPTSSVSSLDSFAGAARAGTSDELKLRFRPPGQGFDIDVSFNSAPLCLHFSKNWPLTVTAVGNGFTGSAAVKKGWVLTHVNDEPLFRDYRRASRQFRIAAKSLPRRGSRLFGTGE